MTRIKRFDGSKGHERIAFCVSDPKFSIDIMCVRKIRRRIPAGARINEVADQPACGVLAMEARMISLAPLNGVLSLPSRAAA
jgi:hypothetical protein